LLRIFERDRLKEFVNTTRCHQTVSDGRGAIVQVFGNHSLKFGHDLSVEFARVVERPTQHRDLKQQLERGKRYRQLENLRSPAPQVRANQIEIAIQPAIFVSQAAIDATIFEGAENAASERGNRKQLEHVGVAQIVNLRSHLKGRAQFVNLRYISII